MYLDKRQIKSIQLDHTSRCNLLCPQCARTDVANGTKRKGVKILDLTVENYQTIFEFLPKNVRIMHCGNYGDVIASPTFDETLAWCNDNGYYNIHVLTNGSARKPQWWADLAKRGVTVAFSVDGLKDTNHLYRVNSNFDMILENMTAYINAGGNARWDYLVFDHNYHQLEEARQLAKDINVKEFNVKYTSRFVIPHTNLHKGTVVNRHKKEVNDIQENHNVKEFSEIIQVYKDFNEYVRKTPINCKYRELQRYYIDMEMRLWPCCWMGGPLYMNDDTDPQFIELTRTFERFGADFNRLDIHGWDKILNSEYYQTFLEESWKIDSPDRIFTCGRTCGDKYQFSSGYGKNSKTEKMA